MWILRDLSNGDGAGGHPWPTYIWAFVTREEARQRASWHRRDPAFARLGPVEYRPDSEVRLRYGAEPLVNYLVRKER
jgi:hypothetical protein